MNKYLFYHPGQTPFIAFPSGRSSRALSLFPATTWKKKAIRHYLKVADFSKVPLPAINHQENISIFTTSTQDITHFLKTNNQSATQPILIMWNREYKRKRSYIWLNNTQSPQKTAFAKIGEGANNKIDLTREFKALTALKQLEVSFKTPYPLFLSNDNDISILLSSALPDASASFSFLEWQEIDQHLTPLTKATQIEISYSQLENLRWYKLFQQRIDQTTSQLLKTYFLKKTSHIGFVHGDMGSENTFIINGQLWIIDWEKSSREGPIATDPVAHWLGKNAQNIGLNQNITSSFLQTFANHPQLTSNDVLLALCYLTLMNFPPAIFIFHYLKHDNFARWQ